VRRVKRLRPQAAAVDFVLDVVLQQRDDPAGIDDRFSRSEFPRQPQVFLLAGAELGGSGIDQIRSLAYRVDAAADADSASRAGSPPTGLLQPNGGRHAGRSRSGDERASHADISQQGVGLHSNRISGAAAQIAFMALRGR